MTVEPTTPMPYLLDRYPFLLDFLTSYHPHFQRLLDPAHRSQMPAEATVLIASAAAEVPVTQLVADLQAEIDRHDGGTAD